MNNDRYDELRDRCAILAQAAAVSVLEGDMDVARRLASRYQDARTDLRDYLAMRRDLLAVAS